MSGGASSAAIRRLPYTNRERLHNLLVGGTWNQSQCHQAPLPMLDYTCKYLDPAALRGAGHAASWPRHRAEKAMARQGLGTLEPPVPGPRQHYSGREVPRISRYMTCASLVPAIHLSRHIGIWGAERPPTLLVGATLHNEEQVRVVIHECSVRG
ncbi:hypothetical protein GGI35DRAFT_76098 [Trichoderma velutinum]